MKYILILLLSAFSVPALCQQHIKIEDVASRVGDSVTLTSTVYSGRYLENVKGSPTFLNIGGNYPNAPLTVVIWSDVRKQFKEAPEVMWKDHPVFIRGRIELYKGKPQITLTSANNIEQVVAPPMDGK